MRAYGRIFSYRWVLREFALTVSSRRNPAEVLDAIFFFAKNDGTDMPCAADAIYIAIFPFQKGTFGNYTVLFFSSLKMEGWEGGGQEQF